MSDSQAVLEAFHATLVDEIRRQRPEYLSGPFTVAEIYQNLVPYGTHRDRIGVDMNADYEDALLRLLAGEGDYLVLDSAPALRGIREELESSNPNTGLYREYAAVDVRLNPLRTAGAADGGDDLTGDSALEEASPWLEPELPPEDEPMSMEDLAPTLELSSNDEPATEEDASQATTMELRTPDTGDSAPSSDAGEAPADASACRWCRAELPSRGNLRFCPFCGTDVNLVPCAQCGEELEDGWRFCISCGTEVPE